MKSMDPTLDLLSADSDALNSGYGIARDGRKESEQAVKRRKKEELVEDVIRDLNRHAGVVLDGVPDVRFVLAPISDAPSLLCACTLTYSTTCPLARILALCTRARASERCSEGCWKRKGPQGGCSVKPAQTIVVSLSDLPNALSLADPRGGSDEPRQGRRGAQ